MKYLLLLSMIWMSSYCVEVVRVSEDVTVKQGEDVTLECEADGQFDTCTWFLPSGGRCGPLSSSQKMCRASTNIHFNGSDTSCIITVKNIREKDNGNWLCRYI